MNKQEEAFNDFCFNAGHDSRNNEVEELKNNLDFANTVRDSQALLLKKTHAENVKLKELLKEQVDLIYEHKN
jgi:hypothetical protein